MTLRGKLMWFFAIAMLMGMSFTAGMTMLMVKPAVDLIGSGFVLVAVGLAVVGDKIFRQLRDALPE